MLNAAALSGNSVALISVPYLAALAPSAWQPRNHVNLVAIAAPDYEARSPY